jgi:hypothetical protein
MERKLEESDQLPEDAPEEVVEEEAKGEVREAARRNPGSADEDADQATGHPENAG